MPNLIKRFLGRGLYEHFSRMGPDCVELPVIRGPGVKRIDDCLFQPDGLHKNSVPLQVIAQFGEQNQQVQIMVLGVVDNSGAEYHVLGFLQHDFMDYLRHGGHASGHRFNPHSRDWEQDRLRKAAANLKVSKLDGDNMVVYLEWSPRAQEGKLFLSKLLYEAVIEIINHPPLSHN